MYVKVKKFGAIPVNNNEQIMPKLFMRRPMMRMFG